MSKPPTVSAAALVAANDTCTAEAELTHLQSAVLGQFHMMGKLRGEETLRGLVVGLALVRMKQLLPYGSLGPWVKANVSNYSERYVAYMKRLGEAFIKEVRLSEHELRALPDEKTTLQLTTMEGVQRKLMQKAVKFVGDHSLNELFELHEIKTQATLGGAREHGAKKAMPLDAEQLYLLARDEIGSVIQRAEDLLLKENRLQHLVGHAEEIRGVVYALRTLTQKIESAAKDLLKPAPSAGSGK